jgi:predicted ATP-grasp superfamily ATP-dependent carboligase
LWLSAQLPVCPGLITAGPGPAAAKLALDKALQIETARRAGFQVLETTVASTAAEVRSQASRLPLILKSAGAVTAQNGRLVKTPCWICGTPAELEKAIQQWSERTPLLAQSFVQGTGEGIFGMALPGGIKTWSAHRRLRMMNPHGSGSSAAISQPVPAELMAPAQRFVDQAGWRGLFMIELLRDTSGQRWFMEFNGRPWGSTALSRRQGLEYPAWNVLLAMNPESTVAEVAAAPPMVCRNLGRELLYPLFVLRGPKSCALKQWPSFWKALCEVLQIGRDDHFYNWRRNDRRVFVGDCYYTIRDQLFKSKG